MHIEQSNLALVVNVNLATATALLTNVLVAPQGLCSSSRPVVAVAIPDYYSPTTELVPRALGSQAAVKSFSYTATVLLTMRCQLYFSSTSCLLALTRLSSWSVAAASIKNCSCNDPEYSRSWQSTS